MKKLESPYRLTGPLGLSQDFYIKREIRTLWEKVDEIVDWINEREEKDKKKHPIKAVP